MKTFLKITILLGLLASACCLTSCGDENDDDYAAEIAGTYLGENNFKGISAYVNIMRMSNQTVEIKYDDNVASKAGAEVTFNKVSVSKSGSTYNLSGTDGLDSEIKGSINGNELNLQVEYLGARSFIFQGYKQ